MSETPTEGRIVQATVGRIVHFHPVDGNGYLLEAGDYAGVVVGQHEEGTADIFLFPTRYTPSLVLQGIPHDDDLEPDPEAPGPHAPHDEVLAHEARTIHPGSWGWPPRA